MDSFKFDVFISHSHNDKPVARDLAEKLQADGLRIWLDEWVIKPGDLIPLAIESGLENSRTLVFLMSANAFASEWVTLERHTVLFRDPTNQQRRFIPVRIDDSHVKDTLRQFAYVDWRDRDEAAYRSLVSVCRSSVEPDVTPRSDAQGIVRSMSTHDGVTVASVVPAGDLAVTASSDMTVRLWDVSSFRRRATFQGHTRRITAVDITPNGSQVVSASEDEQVRVWDPETGQTTMFLAGHECAVTSLAVTPDGTHVISGDTIGDVRVWDLESGSCDRTLKGVKSQICSLTTAHGCIFAGCDDGTILAWKTEDSASPATVLRGHSMAVTAIKALEDDSLIVSTSEDTTLRAWDIHEKRCVVSMEGHTAGIAGLSLLVGTSTAVTCDRDGEVRVWDLSSGECLNVMSDRGGVVSFAATPDGTFAVSAIANALRLWDISKLSEATKEGTGHTQRYTNAKVLLVGDSGVGKSGLAIRLTEDTFRPTESTDAHWATQLKLPQASNGNTIDREIWLWDFAGQADYRIIHQLFMDETALAILVFNPQSENPFEGLGQWDRDLDLAARRRFAKLLVAGRCDRGGLTVSRESVDQFVTERGFSQFINTSAKTGKGCETLREAITNTIDWESIPWTASPQIFKLLKEEIIKLSDEGYTLLRLGELKQQLEMRHPNKQFTYKQLKAVVGLLAGPGHVWQLEFGDFILLHPEKINSYAAAVGRTVRSHLQQIGIIHESALLAGQLSWGDIERLPPDEEAILLRAMHQTLVDHGFCLTEETEAGPLLVFPSYFNRERRDQIDHPSIVGTFRFSGPLEEMYATLVVKLHHTRTFETEQLWRYAADFRSLADGGRAGFKMTKRGEGDAEITAYCHSVKAVNDVVSEAKAASARLSEAKSRADDAAAIYADAKKEADQREREVRRLKEAVKEAQKALKFAEGTPKQPAIASEVQKAKENLDSANATLASAKAVAAKYQSTAREKRRPATHAGELAAHEQEKAEQAEAVKRRVVEPIVTFMRYIGEHLRKYDPDVTLVRHYVCRNPDCEEPVRDVSAILRARERGFENLPCQYCFEPIPMWDELEQELMSEAYESRVHEMELNSRAGIRRESGNLMLEYHAFSIAEETGQQFVPLEDASIGVHGRLDLVDFASGQPSGQSVYLQLRPAEVFESISVDDSGATIFELGTNNLQEAWLCSAFPVMLLHRTDDGYISWMDLRAEVLARSERGDEMSTSRKFEFNGEPFTALNLQRLRKKLLNGRETARKLRPL